MFVLGQIQWHMVLPIWIIIAPPICLKSFKIWVHLGPLLTWIFGFKAYNKVEIQTAPKPNLKTLRIFKVPYNNCKTLMTLLTPHIVTFKTWNEMVTQDQLWLNHFLHMIQLSFQTPPRLLYWPGKEALKRSPYLTLQISSKHTNHNHSSTERSRYHPLINRLQGFVQGNYCSTRQEGESSAFHPSQAQEGVTEPRMVEILDWNSHTPNIPLLKDGHTHSWEVRRRRRTARLPSVPNLELSSWLPTGRPQWVQ